jgi:DNA-binding NarL/FixJ family response regulator
VAEGSARADNHRRWRPSQGSFTLREALINAVSDADELRDAVRRFIPDAVLTDIGMPPGHHMEGIDAHRHDNRSRAAM